MKWPVLTLVQFLPKYDRISMQARFAWMSIGTLHDIHVRDTACGSTCGSILNGHVDYILNEWRIDNQRPMKLPVLTLVQFLPKYHVISMEERFARVAAVCTTYMWCSMWIDTQRMADRYSRTDEVESANAWLILAQIPFDFYGGEN
jgi:hypothetical protein